MYDNDEPQVYVYVLDDNNNIVSVSINPKRGDDQKEDLFFTLKDEKLIPAEPIEQGEFSGKWYFEGQVDQVYENNYAMNVLKEQLTQENNNKCEEARTSQTFIVQMNDHTNLHFLTDRTTQADLQAALVAVGAGVKYPWTDEDGCTFTFTKPEQVTFCLQTLLEKANVYDKWAKFKEQIESAKTVEELQNIHIEY